MRVRTSPKGYVSFNWVRHEGSGEQGTGGGCERRMTTKWMSSVEECGKIKGVWRQVSCEDPGASTEEPP